LTAVVVGVAVLVAGFEVAGWLQPVTTNKPTIKIAKTSATCLMRIASNKNNWLYFSYFTTRTLDTAKKFSRYINRSRIAFQSLVPAKTNLGLAHL